MTDVTPSNQSAGGLREWISRRRELLLRFVLITSGSAFFVTLKTALVWLVQWLTTMPEWLNYFLVTIAVTLIGWVYHSKVSFRQPLNRQTLIRYIQQAIAIKLLVDNGLYNLLVYAFHVNAVWAVPAVGVVSFTTRVTVYLKYVFVAKPPPADSVVQDPVT